MGSGVLGQQSPFDQRHPTMAGSFVRRLERGEELTPTMPSAVLARHHFPGVEGLVQGGRPPEWEAEDFEPGETRCGWQHEASSVAILAQAQEGLIGILLFPGQPRVMPRRGWRAVEVPEGWLKVIRGPRPTSVPDRARQNSRGGEGGVDECTVDRTVEA